MSSLFASVLMLAAIVAVGTVLFFTIKVIFHVHVLLSHLAKSQPKSSLEKKDE